MTVEDQIYAMMKQNGVKQATVARALEMAPQQLNEILKGRRPLRARHILPICKTIGCEPNELFGYEKKNHQITVTDAAGQVIAAVLGDSVVEHEGFHIILS